MKIMLIADKIENLQDYYKMLSNTFEDADIVIFAQKSDCQNLSKKKMYKSATIVEYSKNLSASIDNYIVSTGTIEDTLFIYTSIEINNSILQNIKLNIASNKKMIIFKSKKQNIFKKIITKIYNVCINIFVQKIDSMADPRIIYLSKKKLKSIANYGTKMRILKDNIDIGDTVELYTNLPKIKFLISKYTIISFIFSVLMIGLLSLNAFFNLTILLNIILSMLLISSLATNIMLISKDYFDSRIKI